MDADTVVRCILEVKRRGQHQLEAIDLLRAEFQSSDLLSKMDRDNLLGHLSNITVENGDLRVESLIEILMDYQPFKEQLVDFLTIRLSGKPDDRAG